MRRVVPNDDTVYQRIERTDQGDGPWVECDRCGFPAPVASFRKVWNGLAPDEEERLCALCANTIQPGTRNDYSARQLAKSLCFVGNAILNAMGMFEEDVAPFKESS